MKILVINCGSSSIKYQLYEMPDETVLAKGVLEKVGEEGSVLTHQPGEEKITTTVSAPDHEQGLKIIMQTLVDQKTGVTAEGSTGSCIANLEEIKAVGHRVVHGGEAFSGSVKITDEVIKVIDDYADLAPLHNPPNLAGIKAAAAVLPDVPQVACFDTAFHQTIPEQAYMYALPYELYEKFKIRRYGFHGTSHRYVARRAAQLLNKGKYEANIITCHLGNGCSMAAVKQGKSVDTSMGLTPLEGLVMGTRSGDVDPAIIFYLQDRQNMCGKEINALMNKKSGLLGVSGISNDMRNIIEEADKGSKRAQLAVDIFCYRIKKYIGAYTAVLGSLDAVVFTGGIGENASKVREKILDNLEVLGIIFNPARNTDSAQKERVITTDDSKVQVFVIPTDEEGAIARDTYEITSS